MSKRANNQNTIKNNAEQSVHREVLENNHKNESLEEILRRFDSIDTDLDAMEIPEKHVFSEEHERKMAAFFEALKNGEKIEVASRIFKKESKNSVDLKNKKTTFSDEGSGDKNKNFEVVSPQQSIGLSDKDLMKAQDETGYYKKVSQEFDIKELNVGKNRESEKLDNGELNNKKYFTKKKFGSYKIAVSIAAVLIIGTAAFNIDTVLAYAGRVSAFVVQTFEEYSIITVNKAKDEAVCEAKEDSLQDEGFNLFACGSGKPDENQAQDETVFLTEMDSTQCGERIEGSVVDLSNLNLPNTEKQLGCQDAEGDCEYLEVDFATMDTYEIFDNFELSYHNDEFALVGKYPGGMMPCYRYEAADGREIDLMAMPDDATSMCDTEDAVVYEKELDGVNYFCVEKLGRLQVYYTKGEILFHILTDLSFDEIYKEIPKMVFIPKKVKDSDVAGLFKARVMSSHEIDVEYKNHSHGELNYDLPYRLEVFKNGSWEVIPSNLDYVAVVKTLAWDEEVEDTIDLYNYGDLKDELPDGVYRITKRFTGERTTEVDGTKIGESFAEDVVFEFETKDGAIKSIR